MPNVVALSLIADLVFSVQVEETANRLGFRVSTPDNAISALRQGRARLFVMDLAAAGDRLAEVAQVFGPHIEREAHQADQGTGVDLVVSKSRFSGELAQLMITCLDRHRESVAGQGAGE